MLDQALRMNPWGPFLEQNPKRNKIHGKKTKIKQNTGKNQKKARPKLRMSKSKFVSVCVCAYRVLPQRTSFAALREAFSFSY